MEAGVGGGERELGEVGEGGGWGGGEEFFEAVEHALTMILALMSVHDFLQAHGLRAQQTQPTVSSRKKR